MRLCRWWGHNVRLLEAAWNTYIGFPLRGSLGPSYWASASCFQKHGPELYRQVDATGMEFLAAIQRHTTQTDSVLDVGCGPHGRHLRALWRRGYRRLAGVDVAAPSSKYFKTYRQSFETMLPACEDKSFDTAVSYSATLELVSPKFPIVSHLCRIARNVIVLMLHERGHAYPRLWRTEFRWYGWQVVGQQCPILPGVKESLLILKPR